MRIGVDIDGVIADSYPAWLKELNRHYGKNISVLEDYDMHLVFDVAWDDMNDFFVENVDHLLGIPQPVVGAKEGIETLIQEGHDIFYITARRPEEEAITLDWLRRYNIPYETVLFSGFKSKVDLVQQWNMQAFIEDHLANAKDISGLGIPVFLLATSYNQGELSPQVTRCQNWSEILQGLRHLVQNEG
ncbi:MAG: 5' nucleotidase, NT5C type [Desulfitobacteriaceae bacterium]